MPKDIYCSTMGDHNQYHKQWEYFPEWLQQCNEMLPLGEAIQESLSNDISLKCSVKQLSSDLTEALNLTCDVESITHCLSLGVDPNLPLPCGLKIITYIIGFASSDDWEDVVRILLEAGADPNTRDPKGNPLLTILMPSGKTDLIELAIKKGADVESKGPTGETPLLEAVHFQRVECVRLLLQNGANPNHIASDGNSILIWAAGRTNGMWMRRSHMCVKILLEYGANPNYQNPIGYTPLMAATLIRESEHVKTLLVAGAVPDMVDSDGETALMKAVVTSSELMKSVVTSSENVVQVLLKGKAKINIKCKGGWSAPMVSKSEDILSILLFNGTDFGICDNFGNSVLHHQAKKDLPESCQLCLEYGAELDGINDNGDTPLQIAVRTRCRKTIMLLMSLGANINNVNTKSISILHDAILSTDYFETTNIFPIINTKELHEQFMYCSRDGYDFFPENTKVLIQCLLNDGVDVNHSGEGGVTSLMLASAIGDISLVNMLLSAGAAVDTIDDGGRIALSYACKLGHFSIVKLLISNDTPINFEDEEGNLPVFYAAECCNDDILMLFMVELAFYYQANWCMRI